MIVDYKGEPTYIKKAYTANPKGDEWHIYNSKNQPTRAVTMPKNWEPSKTMRVNGMLGL